MLVNTFLISVLQIGVYTALNPAHKDACHELIQLTGQNDPKVTNCVEAESQALFVFDISSKRTLNEQKQLCTTIQDGQLASLLSAAEFGAAEQLNTQLKGGPARWPYVGLACPNTLIASCNWMDGNQFVDHHRLDNSYLLECGHADVALIGTNGPTGPGYGDDDWTIAPMCYDYNSGECEASHAICKAPLDSILAQSERHKLKALSCQHIKQQLGAPYDITACFEANSNVFFTLEITESRTLEQQQNLCALVDQGNLASIANEDELGACEQIKVQLQAKDGTWPYVGFKCSNTSLFSCERTDSQKYESDHRMDAIYESKCDHYDIALVFSKTGFGPNDWSLAPMCFDFGNNKYGSAPAICKTPLFSQ